MKDILILFGWIWLIVLGLLIFIFQVHFPIPWPWCPQCGTNLFEWTDGVVAAISVGLGAVGVYARVSNANTEG